MLETEVKKKFDLAKVGKVFTNRVSISHIEFWRNLAVELYRRRQPIHCNDLAEAIRQHAPFPCMCDIPHRVARGQSYHHERGDDVFELCLAQYQAVMSALEAKIVKLGSARDLLVVEHLEEE